MNGWSFFRRALLAFAFCAPLIAASGEALAHLGAGLKQFDLERYSEAAKEFELALRLDPSLNDARYHLGVSLFNSHRYPQARQQFEVLVPLGYRSDWVTYYLARLDLVDGRLDSAIAQFESLRRSEPLQDELYYLGSAYMKKGEVEKAVPILQRAVEFNPRDFRAHEHLARAYVKAGRPQEAEREFAETSRLHDYYLQGKQELDACRAQLSTGHADQAWASCGSVLETDDIDKLVAAGMLFGEFGHYHRAMQLFEKALALDPESSEINFDMGLTYFRIKDCRQARKYLEAATRFRPNFFEAVALYGTVLYVLREDAAALDALRRAHQLRPNDPAVTKLLAQIESRSPR